MIMIPNLPRPLLWTEKTSMEDFVEDDYINMAFYNIFLMHPTGFLSLKKGMLRVFNEVYYLLTRIYYEKPKPEDYPRYVSEINEDFGWDIGVDLIMTMVVHYIDLRYATPSSRISVFVDYIRRELEKSPVWEWFLKVTKPIPRRGKFAINPKHPNPVSPSEVEGLDIDWQSLTDDYAAERIGEVLALWSNKKDRLAVGGIISGKPVIESFQPIVAEKPVKQLSAEEKVVKLLDTLVESYIKNHKGPKFILMPVRAAKDAGALPMVDLHWVNDHYKHILDKPLNKTNWSDWINMEEVNYEGRALRAMTKSFELLINSQNRGDK